MAVNACINLFNLFMVTNIRFTNFLQSYSGCLHIFSMIQDLNEASEQISHMHFTRAVNIGIRQNT